MSPPDITALPALLGQLDAQAAEIERLNKGFHESCIAREEGLRANARYAEHVATLAKERADRAEARVKGLEELLRKHAALACSACAGTGCYLGDEDRDGPCDVCDGTGAVLPADVAAVLAKSEGGR